MGAEFAASKRDCGSMQTLRLGYLAFARGDAVVEIPDGNRTR